MKELTLMSWNVNGIRAVAKKEVYKGLLFKDWIIKDNPHILCLQETKANATQVPADVRTPQGYNSYWHSAERKGYSGVVTYTKAIPQNINKKLGIEKFDAEGRIVETEFKKFILFNVYFPNGKRDQERLDYKMEFYDAFFDYIEKLRSKGKSIIICGDVNTAHTEIDLSHPKANEKNSGFLKIEREWIDKLLSHGYIDTFRHIHGDIPEKYTWWSMRTQARQRNVGWRIDYFYISGDLKDSLVDAFIRSDVMGSDHCPIGIKIKV